MLLSCYFPLLLWLLLSSKMIDGLSAGSLSKFWQTIWDGKFLMLLMMFDGFLPCWRFFVISSPVRPVWWLWWCCVIHVLVDTSLAWSLFPDDDDDDDESWWDWWQWCRAQVNMFLLMVLFTCKLLQMPWRWGGGGGGYMHITFNYVISIDFDQRVCVEHFGPFGVAHFLAVPRPQSTPYLTKPWKSGGISMWKGRSQENKTLSKTPKYARNHSNWTVSRMIAMSSVFFVFSGVFWFWQLFRGEHSKEHPWRHKEHPCHRFPEQMIKSLRFCGWSLRFVYAVKRYAAMLSGE